MYTSIVRALRTALLILTVFIGQAHACSTYFVASNGQKCTTCATLPCAYGSLNACRDASLVAEKAVPKDCHDCCSLRTCDERENHADKAGAFSQVPEILLTVFELPQVRFPEIELLRISIFAADQYANPPPGPRSSRAPPLQLN